MSLNELNKLVLNKAGVWQSILPLSGINQNNISKDYNFALYYMYVNLAGFILATCTKTKSPKLPVYQGQKNHKLYVNMYS